MNAKEATERIAINISELSQRFYVGISNAKGEAFIEKKDMTSQLLAHLFKYLEGGKAQWGFTAPDGKEYALQIVEKER